jgi:pimeloyl-ACP methyl ester carboxylesterase
MKLVLLPGMDGTGELFSYILEYLKEFDTQVISLPQTGSQDYPTIINYIKSKLPNQEFTLIAESFSGALAAELAKEHLPNLKKIAFVATFLSPPNAALLSIAAKLPLKSLSKVPLAKYIQKQLFIGKSAKPELVDLFQSILNKLPSEILSNRIKTMQDLAFSTESLDIPCLYIQALSDRLVSANKYSEFQQYFSNIKLVQFEGPHFIMQTKPRECAIAIAEHAST